MDQRLKQTSELNISEKQHPVPSPNSSDVLMGIDIGTYSSKGVICRPDGSIIAEARVEHTLSMPQPGYAEHDADGVWWQDFTVLSKKLTATLPQRVQVAAIAVSACGPCLLPVDGSGQPLRPGILYGIDARASNQIAELEARCGAREILNLSGTRLTSQSVGPKILWLQQNEPHLFASTTHFLTATSYIIYKLTGELVVDHHHASYFAPFFDLRRGQWDLRFAEGLLTPSVLPEIRWSNEMVGTVTPRAAPETGLLAGTPVIAGTTDGLAEAISVGIIQPGMLMLMYGSTLGLMTPLERLRRAPNLWLSEGAFPGEYIVAGGLSTAGAITNWFRKEFARELPQESNVEIGEAYATLIYEAEQSSIGSKGLLMLPYFSGERSPFNDPQARGVIVGLSLTHSRGDLYRSILEATALGVRHNLEEMRRSGAVISRVHAVGGGTVSRLWPQIVSDATGLTQEIPERTIGASYGDAFLAGLSVGLVSKESLLRDWVKIIDRVEADPGITARYDDLYRLYRQLYRATRSVVHDLGREVNEHRA
jgi:xylulokinase